MPNNRFWKLSLISFIILFLELVLIRLIGTEVRIFAYYSNLILLGIFIGSGTGMLIKKKIPLVTSLYLLSLVFILTLFGVFSPITNLISPLTESFIWFQAILVSPLKIALGLVFTITIFIFIMLIFIPLGQYLGELFDTKKKILLLYSINIAFSLIGIWMFYAVSFLDISPYIGVIVGLVLITYLSERKYKIHGIVLATLCILVFVIYNINSTNKIIWSPYQKLILEPMPKNDVGMSGYNLHVNNVGYMSLADLSDNYTKQLTEKLKKTEKDINLTYANQYNLPYQINTNAKKILIIGSGGGNDIAGAVRNNIESIDAVEIDPKIAEIGEKYHPEKPYSSSSVTKHINDGRTFLINTKEKYDIVILGLADSHTLNSSYNDIQLDNYLYTKESIEEIKNVLTPNGMLFLNFDVNENWIGGRIQKNLTEVFGYSPTIFSVSTENSFYGWGGIAFVQGNKKDMIQNILNENQSLKEYINSRIVSYDTNINSLTDNWPYLYLSKPQIPLLHIIISISLLALIIWIGKSLKLFQGFQLSPFFLGAGFLLYEFQNISKTALLFGNTWFTSALTISAILIFILIANFILMRFRLPQKTMYLLLLVGFIIQFYIPLTDLSTWSFTNKLIWGSLLLSFPLLFSSIIFGSGFSTNPKGRVYLASNLIGSAVGGFLALFSYQFGLQSLLWISLLCYVFAFLTTFYPRIPQIFKK